MVGALNPAAMQLAAAQVAGAASPIFMASMGHDSYLGDCLYGMHELLGAGVQGFGAKLGELDRVFGRVGLGDVYYEVLSDVDAAGARSRSSEPTDTPLGGFKEKLIAGSRAELTAEISSLAYMMRQGRGGIPLARPALDGAGYDPLVHRGYEAGVLKGLVGYGALERGAVDAFVTEAARQLDSNLDAVEALKSSIFVGLADPEMKEAASYLGGGICALIAGGFMLAMSIPLSYISFALVAGGVAAAAVGANTLLRGSSRARRYREAFGLPQRPVGALDELTRQNLRLRSGFEAAFPYIVSPRSETRATAGFAGAGGQSIAGM